MNKRYNNYFNNILKDIFNNKSDNIINIPKYNIINNKRYYFITTTRKGTFDRLRLTKHNIIRNNIGKT